MIDKPVMLITGTSRGLGLNLAKHYSVNGFFVVGCSRNITTINNENFFHLSGDISDMDFIKSILNHIKTNYGRLDVLINNAGLSSALYLLMQSSKHINDVVNTNLIAALNMTRESVKLMKNNKFGRIINFSSVHVPLATEGTTIYSSIKAAIEQFSRIAAKEIAGYGITINSLGLSLVNETGMVSDLSDKIKENIFSNLAIKKNLEIADIIHLIDFIIDKKTNFITGQTIYTSGV